MRKKNLFLVMLAMVLVCAISVTGTLAYLTMTTEDKPVINTFMAAGGGALIVDPDGDSTEYEGPVFTLLETKVSDSDSDGIYTSVTPEEKVTENKYNVLPGVNLPKDPTITINKKTDAPAYLYIEVVGKDALADYGLTFNMENGWMELSGVKGDAEEGTVYVYTGSTTDAGTEALPLVSTNCPSTVKVIKNDTIYVSNNTEDITKIQKLGTVEEDAPKLKFYAYMAQSTVTVTEGTTTSSTDDAKTVYTTCFN